MPTPQYYQLRDFSPGQNNAFDPRDLMPVSSEDQRAEGVIVQNYDTTQKGALITDVGYEEYISLGTGEPPNYVGSYRYDVNNRYLVSASNNQLFYTRKYDFEILHDCEATSNAYGTWTGHDDASSPSATATRVRGDFGITYSISGATSGNDYGTMRCTFASPVDVSAYTDIELFARFTNKKDTTTPTPVDIFSNVEIRLHTDASNYYSRTFTKNGRNDGMALDLFWNGYVFEFSGASSTGAPDLSSIAYIDVVMNYSGDLAGTNFNIDDIRATKDSDTLRVVEMTAGVWSSTTDEIVVNGVDGFTGKKGAPLHVLINSTDDACKITHVGPGMLIAEDISGRSKSTSIATMMNFLFIGKGAVLNYSDAEDETEWNILGASSEIVGLSPTQDKKLLVQLMDKKTQAVSFQFDDTNLLFIPMIGPYQAGVGGMGQKSIQNRYNDALSWTSDGVAYFGESEAIASGNYRVSSLSWKIDPLLNKANKNKSHLAASYYHGDRKDYGLCVPIGTVANSPNTLFIYNSEYNSWAYRTGITMNHATEHRIADTEELFFADSQSDKIMKFNNLYDYNGEGYVRRWRSKIFDMGLPLITKRMPFIEVGGAMPVGAEFYAVIYADDGSYEAFKIDDTALVVSRKHKGYIGDDFYGTEFIGGTEADTPYEFFRFYQRIPLPDSIVESKQYQIEFYYEGAGNPHKIDLLGMKFIIGPEGKVADRHINSQKVDNLFLPT